MKSPGHLTGVSALQGTFLVRPGLSLAGCMVISAVVPEGPCKHMALDSNQLNSRSLEVSSAVCNALVFCCRKLELACVRYLLYSQIQVASAKDLLLRCKPSNEGVVLHCILQLANALCTQRCTST